MQFFAPLLCFFLAIAMADAREQRREYAQVLRRFAASLGVARCRDNASREQVKEMADASPGLVPVCDVRARRSGEEAFGKEARTKILKPTDFEFRLLEC